MAQQIAGGEKAIMGVMVESHLRKEIRIWRGDAPLVYGKKRATDACIGWEDTGDTAASALRRRQKLPRG
ncbi:hypothetical protein ACNKHW_03570 [Shigella flexneri]